MDRQPSGGVGEGGASRLRRVFYGVDGLRAGWRLLLFNLIFQGLLRGLYQVAGRVLGSTEPPEWTAPLLLFGETASLAVALVAVGAMGRIEGRSLTRYGFPLRRMFGPLFWQGCLWGLLSIALAVGMIAAAGGYTISGLRLDGVDLVVLPLLWALAFLVVALYEELVFRGYELYTLASGIGFWPAAVVLSAIFGFVFHFLDKPGESWVDGLSVTLLALFLAVTVRRTGDVRFAVGWHFAFNFGSMFLFGSPNTGNGGRPLAGRFLESAWHGPEWLTGGGMGAEASIFIFAVVGVLFWAFARRFPGVRFPHREADRRPSSPGPPLGARGRGSGSPR